MTNKRKAILIDKLTIKYKDACIIENMNTSIPLGSITALTGDSGQGKTSLINAIMGLIPFEGSFHNLRDKKIAAVFQEDRLVQDLSALSNITICAKADRQTIEAHLAALSLAEAQHKKASELSGGMRRRVAIIRAVLAESDLLILDEPFKGLDEKIKQAAMDYVKKHQDGRTIILVTHDQHEITYMGCKPVIDLVKNGCG